MMESILATAMMIGMMRLILVVGRIDTIIMIPMKMETKMRKIAMLMSMMSRSAKINTLR